MIEESDSEAEDAERPETNTVQPMLQPSDRCCRLLLLAIRFARGTTGWKACLSRLQLTEIDQPMDFFYKVQRMAGMISRSSMVVRAIKKLARNWACGRKCEWFRLLCRLLRRMSSPKCCAGMMVRNRERFTTATRKWSRSRTLYASYVKVFTLPTNNPPVPVRCGNLPLACIF